MLRPVHPLLGTSRRYRKNCYRIITHKILYSRDWMSLLTHWKMQYESLWHCDTYTQADDSRNHVGYSDTQVAFVYIVFCIFSLIPDIFSCSTQLEFRFTNCQSQGYTELPDVRPVLSAYVDDESIPEDPLANVAVFMAKTSNLRSSRY